MGMSRTMWGSCWTPLEGASNARRSTFDRAADRTRTRSAPAARDLFERLEIARELYGVSEHLAYSHQKYFQQARGEQPLRRLSAGLNSSVLL